LTIFYLHLQVRFYLRYPTKSGQTMDFDVDGSRGDWTVLP
jgi:hypothetical protein